MTFDDRPEAAKRLEKARKNAGFSRIKDATDRFGWSYPSYQQHEQGLRGLSRVAEKYARAYRVSEAWLLTGEDSSHPNGYSREVIISVARELSEEGVLPPNDDLDTVVKAFLELCDEHARRLSNPRTPLDLLKSHP